jgi:hypothetical protein
MVTGHSGLPILMRQDRWPMMLLSIANLTWLGAS